MANQTPNSTPGMQEYRKLIEIVLDHCKVPNLRKNAKRLIETLLSTAASNPDALLKVISGPTLNKEALIQFVADSVVAEVPLLAIPGETVQRVMEKVGETSVVQDDPIMDVQPPTNNRDYGPTHSPSASAPPDQLPERPATPGRRVTESPNQFFLGNEDRSQINGDWTPSVPREDELFGCPPTPGRVPVNFVPEVEALGAQNDLEVDQVPPLSPHSFLEVPRTPGKNVPGIDPRWAHILANQPKLVLERVKASPQVPSAPPRCNWSDESSDSDWDMMPVRMSNNEKAKRNLIAAFASSSSSSDSDDSSQDSRPPSTIFEQVPHPPSPDPNAPSTSQAKRTEKVTDFKKCRKSFVKKKSKKLDKLIREGARVDSRAPPRNFYGKVDKFQKPRKASAPKKTAAPKQINLIKCPHCDQLFTRKGNLGRHVRAKHLEKVVYVCSSCQRRFSEHRTMLEHFKVHSVDGEAYKCRKCGLKFNYRQIRNSHEKMCKKAK